MNQSYHAPTRPYGPVDALNRRAAAVGSPTYGRHAAHADYNGHAVQLHWNEYRGYYVAGYTWAGWHVLARGEFQGVLTAALREHNRGALGSRVSVHLKEGDAEAAAICEAEGLTPGDETELPWLTWRHEVAAQSVRDYCFPGAIVGLFDLELLEKAESREEYEAAVAAKHGRCYA